MKTKIKLSELANNALSNYALSIIRGGGGNGYDEPEEEPILPGNSGGN